MTSKSTGARGYRTYEETLEDLPHVDVFGTGNSAYYAHFMHLMKTHVSHLSLTLPCLYFLIEIVPEFHSLLHFRKIFNFECRTDVHTWKDRIDDGIPFYLQQ
jgi:hypothetical protein